MPDSPSYVSDELTHFVGRSLMPDESSQFQLLCRILRERHLRASNTALLGPGGVRITSPTERISTNKAIVGKMVCFCDIPRNQLVVHMAKYGRFGISFPKAYLLGEGACPIYYVPTTSISREVSPYPRTFGQRFDDLWDKLQQLEDSLSMHVRKTPNPAGTFGGVFAHPPKEWPEEYHILGRLLIVRTELEELLFTRLKFFEPNLDHSHENNYYMEREWRITDSVAFTDDALASIIVPSSFVGRLIEAFPNLLGKVSAAEHLCDSEK